jgi:hypothetical protein
VLQRREAELQKAEKKLHDTMRDSNETQRKFEILEAELDRKTRELEKAVSTSSLTNPCPCKLVKPRWIRVNALTQHSLPPRK